MWWFIFRSLEKWKRCSGNENCTTEQLKNKRLCSKHFLVTDFVIYGVGKKCVAKDCCPIDINDSVYSDESNSRIECTLINVNPANNLTNSSNQVSLSSATDNACNSELQDVDDVDA